MRTPGRHPGALSVALLFGVMAGCSLDFDAAFEESGQAADAAAQGGTSGHDASFDGAAGDDASIVETGGTAGSSTEAGAGGFGGSSDDAGDASLGGSGGASGDGGAGGLGGTAGSGGIAGTGGVAGSGGIAGTGGVAGSGGNTSKGGAAGSSGCSPVGHDDDQDGVDDACDNCPGIGNDLQANGDGDGIGNACEGNPSSQLSTIQLFEPFADGLTLGWDVLGGWLEDSDALQFLPGGCGAKACLGTAFHQTKVSGVFGVATAFMIMPGADGAAGLIVGYESTSAPIAVSCQLARTGTALTLDIWRNNLSDSALSTRLDTAPVSGDSEAPSTVPQNMLLTWDGQKLICRAWGTGIVDTKVDAGAGQLPASMAGQTGLAVWNTSAVFMNFVRYGP